MLDFHQFAYLLIFIIPAYVANSTPVILGGISPIDFGAKFIDGKRIFGDGKTWFGLFGGVFCGILSSILLAFVLRGSEFDLFGGRPDYYLLCGIALSTGALAGDLLGSFIKRRVGARWGESTFLDQITFVVVALAFCYPLGLTIVFRPESIAFLILATYFIHRIANSAAHYYGLKKVPW